MTQPDDLRAYMRPGSAYMLEDLPWELRYQALEGHLRAGGAAVVVSRIHPKRLMDQFKLGTAELVWLSASPEDDDGAVKSMAPDATVKMHALLSGFLGKSEGAWAMLDGAEYLVSRVGFNSTVKLIQLVNEAAAVSRGVFVLPVNTEAVEARELGILRRELLPVDARALESFRRARRSEGAGRQKDN
jgi:hypothetical protein